MSVTGKATSFEILDRTPGATGILFDRAQVLDGLDPGNLMTV